MREQEQGRAETVLPAPAVPDDSVAQVQAQAVEAPVWYTTVPALQVQAVEAPVRNWVWEEVAVPARNSRR